MDRIAPSRETCDPYLSNGLFFLFCLLMTEDTNDKEMK